MVTESRLVKDNCRPIDPQGRMVVYWMTAARRTRYNFALQRAAGLAMELDRPLLIFEPFRAAYPHVCARFHAFVIDGMADNRAALANSPVGYWPYLEPRAGQGQGLLAALADQACAIITDWFPCFFYPRMLATALDQMQCRLEAIDSCGLIPLSETPQDFATAYAFRRWLQKYLLSSWPKMAKEEPLNEVELKPFDDEIIDNIKSRWPGVDIEEARADLGRFGIDQTIGPVEGLPGGPAAAGQRLNAFIDRLDGYAQNGNLPSAGAASGLSPYLHFGHLAGTEVLLAVLDREGWSPDRLADRATGSRQGFWGLSESAEAFLDQLITWRELGYIFCHHRPDYGDYHSLPDWARRTLAEHDHDQRPYVYSLADFEAAQTHDPLWNAAMNQLKRAGVIHNYLRMLWGKKILHWSASPEQAWQILVELNNRYALDGRDPNSWSGLAWCLGRFDRAWGPEREVFGKIRFMTSRNTARKLPVGEYVKKYE